ncbi:hypothetical protein ACJ41O_009998 [Fusarium nematophilum]
MALGARGPLSVGARGVPSSCRSCFWTAGRKSPFTNPYYRDDVLGPNHIYLRPYGETPPKAIADLIEHIRRDPDPPSPSRDQIAQDACLQLLLHGADESLVQKYFTSEVFRYPKPGEVLGRSDNRQMYKHHVPSNGGKKDNVCTPVPNLLYGYQWNADPLRRLSTPKEFAANAQRLLLPFLDVEFRGDTGVAGSLVAATNQCLGGSASCVKIAERLKSSLRMEPQADPATTAAFSIAMSGTEARLYVTWKHDDLDYHTAQFAGFLLYDPEQHLRFRSHVRNILDWGVGNRVENIKRWLNQRQEEARAAASQRARARPRPPAGSADDSRAKRQRR